MTTGSRFNAKAAVRVLLGSRIRMIATACVFAAIAGFSHILLVGWAATVFNRNRAIAGAAVDGVIFATLVYLLLWIVCQRLKDVVERRNQLLQERQRMVEHINAVRGQLQKISYSEILLNQTPEPLEQATEKCDCTSAQRMAMRSLMQEAKAKIGQHGLVIRRRSIR
jgi:hypothetical protein